MRKKRVGVFGKGVLAIKVAQWLHDSDEHELVVVLPVMPEPSWTDSFLTWAKDNDVNVVETGHYKDVNPENLDIIFSVFYDKIIREKYINRCNMLLNIHNSPLPHYRGVSPINWALKDNRTEHGITIHKITPGIDDGPIIAQCKYSIYPDFDEVIDVYNRALEYGYTLFVNTIGLIDRITPMKQNSENVIYHGSEDNHLLGERRYFTKQTSKKE
jgi:methionyl-tRNA formyltransferase